MQSHLILQSIIYFLKNKSILKKVFNYLTGSAIKSEGNEVEKIEY